MFDICQIQHNNMRFLINAVKTYYLRSIPIYSYLIRTCDVYFMIELHSSPHTLFLHYLFNIQIH